MLLTFDANEHELVEGQGAVVGHNIGGLDAAQADLAEVLLAGETGQGHISQVCLGVFCHFEGEKMRQEDINTDELTHCTFNQYCSLFGICQRLDKVLLCFLFCVCELYEAVLLPLVDLTEVRLVCKVYYLYRGTEYRKEKAADL